MQVGGQVNRFCRYLGQPIASPAVIEKIGNRFRREVDAFAKAQGVPVLHLAKPDAPVGTTANWTMSSPT
jgi:hypothetical protein